MLYLESNCQWESHWQGGISTICLVHVWFICRPYLQCTHSGLEIFTIQMPHMFLGITSTEYRWVFFFFLSWKEERHIYSIIKSALAKGGSVWVTFYATLKVPVVPRRHKSLWTELSFLEGICWSPYCRSARDIIPVILHTRSSVPSLRIPMEHSIWKSVHKVKVLLKSKTIQFSCSITAQ